MKKLLFALLVVLFLSACGPQYTAEAPLATPSARTNPRPTTTGTPQPPTADPYLYLHGTETALALNQVALDQEAKRLEAQQVALQLTMASDGATSTAVAAATATGRADAISTSAAQTQAAGTATAFVPTQVALTKQAKLDNQQYLADVVGIWIAKAFILVLAVLVLVGLFVAGRKAIHVGEFQFSQMKHDENGRLNAVPKDSIPGTSKQIVIPDLAHRAVVGGADDLSASEALQNTASLRGLEAIRAIRRMPKSSAAGSPQGSGFSITNPVPPLLTDDQPLPNWGEWMQHWTPGKMALGVNENGLIQADPMTSPHFLIAGTTGSGKTRYGVRTLIACALASGWQVVIAGKTLDYGVFSGHSNVHLITYSLLDDPMRAVSMLRNVYREIERRDHLLSSQGFSLWSQTNGPQTMVVIDEFSNLADALEDVDRSKREELWRWARMDTAEARKYGIHMVYALQDPTARSIDLRIRRNTTPIVFRVKDADSSRTVLSTVGAETLPERYFLTVISGLVRGAAFHPTDSDLTAFLDAHPAQELGDPEWIDATVTDVTSEGNTSARDLTIWTMHLEGKSLNEIQRAVFDGKSGGAFFQTVKDVIERYKKADTASTTTGKLPSTGAVAA